MVGARLLRNLTKTPYAAFKRLPEGTVILAEELTPADTALLDPRRIAGFATVLGGAESHTAIMARALEPAGGAGRRRAADRRVAPATRSWSTAAPASSSSTPRPRRSSAMPKQRNALEREQRRLARLRRLPAVTRDGVEIALAGQSRAAARARPGARGGRAGPGPGAHRIPLHEPRRPARRGRAIQGLCRAGARHGGQAGHHPHPRHRRRQARGAARRGDGERGRQSGAGPARDPPVAQGAPPARRAARRRCCARRRSGRCASCCR